MNYHELSTLQKGIMNGSVMETKKVMDPPLVNMEEPPSSANFITMQSPPSGAPNGATDLSGVPTIFKNEANMAVTRQYVQSYTQMQGYIVVSPTVQNVSLDTPGFPTGAYVLANAQQCDPQSLQELQNRNNIEALNPDIVFGSSQQAEPDFTESQFAETSPASSDTTERYEDTPYQESKQSKRNKEKDPDNVKLKQRIKELEDKKSKRVLTKNEENSLNRLRNNLSCRESRKSKTQKDKQRDDTLKKMTKDRDEYKRKCEHYENVMQMLLLSAEVADHIKLFINHHRTNIK